MEPDNDDVQANLPASVRTIRMGDKEIYLVATAHVSKQSVEDVRLTMEAVRPDTVCVELCQSRYKNIIDREQWKRTNIVKIIRQKKAMLLLSSLIMTSFQRRIAKQLGVTPGAEMVEGIQQAERQGARLVLADRDIQTTLRRTWGKLSFARKMKMAVQLMGSLFFVEKIDEETI